MLDNGGGFAELAAKGAALPDVASTGAAKVLVVEDTRFFRSLLVSGISDALGDDVAVVAAETLAEATAVLAGDPSDFMVALVDLELPDAPNGQIIEALRHVGVPLIVFTGRFDETDRDRFIDSHVLDYVVKESPASLAYVVATVRRLHRNRGVKAVVADDSAVARRIVVDLLRDQNMTVVEADDGVPALQHILADPSIRLLVTDYEMPAMDGFELIKEVRRHRHRDSLAILGVSASGSAPLSAKFIKYGANDFINKPFLREEFFCRVSQNMEMLDHVVALTHAATRDALTGLPNRRYFFDVGERMLAASARRGGRPAVAMMDIDFFKKVNDVHGHDAGDEVLKRIAALLAEQVQRGDDLVARLGGEEFAVVLPDVDPASVAPFFDAIRAAVAAEPVATAAAAIPVTMSIGVCPNRHDNLDAMLKEADEMLYGAKQGGRNRVVVAEPL